MGYCPMSLLSSWPQNYVTCFDLPWPPYVAYLLLSAGNFEQWLTSVETLLDIQFCLSLWMEQESLFTPLASPYIQEAAQDQDQIGWANLLLWHLAVARSTLQHGHLTSIGSQHTATSWETGVVTHLLLISHALWTYCNQVVHDRTLDGLAQANELQVVEELHTQFDLGFQDLPFSEQHYIEGHSASRFPSSSTPHRLTVLAHQIGYQQCFMWIQGMQDGLHNFLHPAPAPLES